MGKEIRGGLSVVGALLIAFCLLLYFRLAPDPSDRPDVNIKSTTRPTTVSAPRRPVHGQPTIVKDNSDPYGSADPSSGLGNPRHENHQESLDPPADDQLDGQFREDHYLPVAPALSDDLVAADNSVPDAVAPAETMPTTVRDGENLQRLAQRTYGSTEYQRALWQWLFDRKQIDAVKPQTVLQLPTRAALHRTYPLLVPEESQ